MSFFRMDNCNTSGFNRHSVLMIGLDFGSTTTRAIFASAKLRKNNLNGRMELGDPELIYKPEPVLTPFRDGLICPDDIDECLDNWFRESGVDTSLLFSGGIIITGLAAEQDNAECIAKRVRQRVGHAVVATASDPSLESWLAFMGNTLELSRYEEERPFINLDIGGGTTNPAVAINGNIYATGSYYIGARHFQFEPGTYILLNISDHGRRIAKHLNIHAVIGQELKKEDINLILDHYIHGLEAIVTDSNTFFEQTGQQLIQIPFNPELNDLAIPPVITFSGGVGELIYNIAKKSEHFPVTCFGDLGVELSHRIIASDTLNRHVHSHTPEYGGRATVYGLTLHSAEMSGSTLYMPRPEQLPLTDLPVVARLPVTAGDKPIAQAIKLAANVPQGACMHISLSDGNYPSLKELKGFGERFACCIELLQFPEHLPLLLLVPNDFGKVVGNYASRWGKLPANIMVIDEVPDRNAGFVSLGACQNYVIPVYFYGMH